MSRDAMAATLAFLFWPAGLWLKRQWLLGWAYLVGGGIFAFVTGFGGPFVWIAVVVHSYTIEDLSYEGRRARVGLG